MSDVHLKPLTLEETIEVLIKHYGFHEGIYDLSFEIKLGVGQFGPSPQDALPGAMFGISGVSLVRSIKAGPHSIDAAKVNPAPKTVPARKKKP